MGSMFWSTAALIAHAHNQYTLFVGGCRHFVDYAVDFLVKGLWSSAEELLQYVDVRCAPVMDVRVEFFCNSTCIENVRPFVI